MKTQNIFIGLLLLVTTQAALAVETYLYNISNYPVKAVLIYKNNKKEVHTIPSHLSNPKKIRESRIFLQTTQANPLKEIVFNYIGIPGFWLARINYTKKIDLIGINIANFGRVLFSSYKGTGNTWNIIEEGDFDANEIPEQV